MALTRWSGSSRTRLPIRLAAALGVGAAVAVAAGQAQASVPVFGAVDGFDGARVVGWAASHECGGNPGAAPHGFCLQLRAFYDGPVGTGVPEGSWFVTPENRPDVAAQIGGNGTVGFAHDVRVDAPLQLLDGTPHTIHVYAGTQTSDTEPGGLIGSTTFAAKVHAPVGAVESTAGGVITGWAYDPDAPAQSLAVRVGIAACDDPYGHGYDWWDAAEFVADQPREDVNRVHGTTGAHGFGYTIPPDRLGPGCQEVVVTAEDTERPWDNSHVLATYRTG